MLSLGRHRVDEGVGLRESKMNAITTFLGLLVCALSISQAIASKVCSWDEGGPGSSASGAACGASMEMQKLKYPPPGISTSPLEVPAKILMGQDAVCLRTSHNLDDDKNRQASLCSTNATQFLLFWVGQVAKGGIQLCLGCLTLQKTLLGILLCARCCTEKDTILVRLHLSTIEGLC
jgi:hypothetical protein